MLMYMVYFYAFRVELGLIDRMITQRIDETAIQAIVDFLHNSVDFDFLNNRDFD
jgi:hypothetical protein